MQFRRFGWLIGFENSGKFREPFGKQIARILLAIELFSECSLIPMSWFLDLFTVKTTGTREFTLTAVAPKGIGPNTKANDASFDNIHGKLKRRTRPMGVPIKLKSICDKDK